MIMKGNQRGGGSQLAAHLMNSYDNEVVEIAEVSGTIARDLPGAFSEMHAHSLSTKAEKYLYSLSLSPDQAQGRLTREQYFDLIARTERSLKLIGQPRAVVFHEKRDEKGELRQHCHVVWSRTLIDQNKAVQISHDRLKLRTVARQFAHDYGLELPPGMKKDGRADRFNNRAKQENLKERQQKERTGVSKAEVMADVEACWNGSSDGPGFVSALEDKGYTLAHGERHGKPSYVLVDPYGEIHSISRQLENVTAKEIRQRLASSHPIAGLPSVDDARAAAKQRMEQLSARVDEAHQSPEKSALEKRTEQLHERQQQRRTELDKMRIDLYARQFKERGALREAQAADHAGVSSARLEKQPKGLAAFLTRITGVGKLVTWAQGKADGMRDAEHKRQTAALVGRHGRELKEMDRHDLAIARLEGRENRAAANAELRESRRALRERTFALKPEFEKGVLRQEAAGSGSGGTGKSKAASLFTRLAGAAGFTKGDLQAAFERATAGKTVRKDDSDTTAPGTPSKADLARQLRDDLDRMEPRREDRDRDHER